MRRRSSSMASESRPCAASGASSSTAPSTKPPTSARSSARSCSGSLGPWPGPPGWTTPSAGPPAGARGSVRSAPGSPTSWLGMPGLFVGAPGAEDCWVAPEGVASAAGAPPCAPACMTAAALSVYSRPCMPTRCRTYTQRSGACHLGLAEHPRPTYEPVDTWQVAVSATRLSRTSAQLVDSLQAGRACKGSRASSPAEARRARLRARPPRSGLRPTARRWRRAPARPAVHAPPRASPSAACALAVSLLPVQPNALAERLVFRLTLRTWNTSGWLFVLVSSLHPAARMPVVSISCQCSASSPYLHGRQKRWRASRKCVVTK